MAFLKDKEAAAYQKTHRKHTEEQNKLPILCHKHKLERSVEAESIYGAAPPADWILAGIIG